MRSILFPDRSFWKDVFFLTFPIAIQNMSASLLALLDVSIIKSLGDETVGAVSLANQFSFVTNNMTFGITSGASIFLARYFGEKNPDKVKETFSLSLFFSLSLNLVVSLVCMLFPGCAMTVFTDKAALISLGSDYLRIVGFSYVLMAANTCMTALFRSANKALYVLIPTFLSLSFKTILNYIFIYGAFGVAPLGIRGAALSTLIARTVEFLLYLILYHYCVPKDYRLSFVKRGRLTFEKCKNFLRSTYAVILNESLWAIGLGLFSVIFGRMQVEEISALNIAKTLEELFNSLFYGVGIGAVVVIGRNIGAQDFEKAKLSAKRYIVLGAEIGLLILVLMAGSRNIIVDSFFSGLSVKTMEIAKILILEFALLMPFRSTASAIIMGLMRAGGTTQKAMLYDTLPIYLYSLPVGILLGLVLKLPIVVVLPAMYAKRIIKAVLSLVTALRGKWYQKELMREQIKQRNNQSIGAI
ncbi:MAG: MATE family efflux transporter [Clostridia bacterium]|nr:MATE family efflux transporter [Clostridia bacterium]